MNQICQIIIHGNYATYLNSWNESDMPNNNSWELCTESNSSQNKFDKFFGFNFDRIDEVQCRINFDEDFFGFVKSSYDFRYS